MNLSGKKLMLLAAGSLFTLSAGTAGVWYYRGKIESYQGEWRFAVLGDHEGINPTFEFILNELEYGDIELLVDVGDLTSRGTEEELREVLAEIRGEPYRTEVVVGNNDLGPSSDPDPAVFENAVRSPAYASFDVKNAHFILLDNANRRVGFSDEELDWLEEDLAQNRQPVTVLFMHRPVHVPFEDWIGDDETAASSASNEKFLEILSLSPVDHIFTGHLETYLDYSVSGIPLTVTGGAHNRPDQTGFGASLPSTPHYVLVTVRGEEMEIEKIDLPSQ